jgi:biotin synthase-related radical SAM superfamily protein
MQSPEYVSLSLASAITLRLQSGRFYRDARPSCANLLLTYPQTCLANCSYCGLARERPGIPGDKSFIRVEWPEVSMSVFLDHLEQYGEGTRRLCLSMVTHGRAYRDSMEIIERLTTASQIPLSVLVAPNLLDRQKLDEMKRAGVDMIGVGLDAASERVFNLRRGKLVRGPLDWQNYWKTLETASEIFGPGKVNCHVVVGLGETDLDLVTTFRRLDSLGVASYLFSFYPEPESRMARAPRAPLVRWRRIQLVKHLLEAGLLPPDRVAFDDAGRLCRLTGGEDIDAAIEERTAFMTDGCPGEEGAMACNRPFGSYRPGETFRDFPFPPSEEDGANIRRELRLDRILRS